MEKVKKSKSALPNEFIRDNLCSAWPKNDRRGRLRQAPGVRIRSFVDQAGVHKGMIHKFIGKEKKD